MHAVGRTVLPVLMILVLGAACTSSDGTPAVHVGDSESIAGASEAAPGTEPTSEFDAGTPGPSPVEAGSGPVPSDSASPRATDDPEPQASPTSTFNPYASDIPLTVSVTPTCVFRGGSVTITVDTEPEVVIGYEAFYSDGKSGSPEPYGAGYGGVNGARSETGQYADSWTVSREAPTGPGRVDVFVGRGDKWGYMPVEFEVVDGPAASCGGR